MKRISVNSLATLAVALAFTAAAAAPVGSAFTYQGQLKQDGVPATGPTDFVFRLFDAASGGNQVGSDVVRNGVAVVNGLFTVDLNFGTTAFNGDARFLDVTVGGTPLSGRQPIGPAPYALKVPGVDGHSLDASDGSPSDALFVNAAGRVGIGTTTPFATLTVEGGLAVLDTANQGILLTSHLLLFTRASDDGFIYKYDEADSTHTFYGEGLPRVSILDNGRVGMGTDTPSRELEVAGPADVEIGIRSTDANGRLWTLQSSRVTGTAQDGTFQIIDRTAGASRLTITPTANVGIGTSSPANPLHLAANADIGAGMSGGSLRIGNPASANLLLDANEIQAASNGTATNLAFNAEGGNVGVGTVSPTAALDVRGGGLTTPVLSVAGSTQASVQITAGNGHPTGAAPTSGTPGNITLSAGDGGFGELCLPSCLPSPSPGGSVTIRAGDASSVPFTNGLAGGDIVLLPGAGGDGAPQDGAPGSVGIGTETPSSNFLLDVNGAVRCTSLTETSSRALKRNIRPLHDALPRLLRLQGVAFDWDEAHGGRSDLGFIAEDAAKIFPELVSWERDGQAATGVNYTHLTAVLVEALKDQQSQIERLVAQRDVQLAARDDEIKILNERLARLEATMERIGGRPDGGKP